MAYIGRSYLDLEGKQTIMASNSFRDYIVATLLVALFIVSFYSFASGIATRYGADLTLSDDYIDLTSMEAQINETSEDAQDWETTFRSDNPFVATGALIMYGIWGVMKLMWSGVAGTFNIFLQGIYNVLGVPPMVTGVILAIFIIGLIFTAWKTIKSGE